MVLDIPSKVTGISDAAVGRIVDLKHIKSVKFPSTMTCLEKITASPALTSITIPSGCVDFPEMPVEFSSDAQKESFVVYGHSKRITWACMNYGLKNVTNHTEKVIAGKAATCTEPGLSDKVYCSVCDLVISEHEEIPATGHSFTHFVSNHDATVDHDGTMSAECDNHCGLVITVANPGSRLANPGERVVPGDNPMPGNSPVPDENSVPNDSAVSDGNAVPGDKSTTDKQRQTITTKKIKTSYKAKMLKKKKQVINLDAKAPGKITYKVTKGARKYISVNSKGKVTLKKGCRKGIYKITIIAAATDDGVYKETKKVITIKVK